MRYAQQQRQQHILAHAQPQPHGVCQQRNGSSTSWHMHSHRHVKAGVDSFPVCCACSGSASTTTTTQTLQSRTWQKRSPTTCGGCPRTALATTTPRSQRRW
jgi:hypothetical protein